MRGSRADGARHGLSGAGGVFQRERALFVQQKAGTVVYPLFLVCDEM